jgi:hypothetical protein
MRNIIIALGTLVMVGAGPARADGPIPGDKPPPTVQSKPGDDMAPSAQPVADSPTPAAAPSVAMIPNGAPPSDVDTPLIHGDFAGALRAADRSLAANPHDPWVVYARGCALAGLGRTQEALGALRKAEHLFPGAHEKGLAIWRRAILLEDAGNCDGARRELTAYEDVVRGSEPESLALADRYQNSCVTRGSQVASKPHPSPTR